MMCVLRIAVCVRFMGYLFIYAPRAACSKPAMKNEIHNEQNECLKSRDEKNIRASSHSDNTEEQADISLYACAPTARLCGC